MSFSDLLHKVKYYLGISVLLQIAIFNSFLWLGNISFVCVCVCIHMCVCVCVCVCVCIVAVVQSLQPHGLQHARPPCPSPSPGVCPSSCPLQW